MTNWNGKDAGYRERGIIPAGLLLLLAALFLSQFSGAGAGRIATDLSKALSDAGRSANAPAGEGDMVPSPLSAAGGVSNDGLWFPSGGHAERRATKNKSGLAEGDASGKLIAAAAGQIRYPFEFCPLALPCLDGGAPPRRFAQAAFRSRAPPAA